MIRPTRPPCSSSSSRTGATRPICGIIETGFTGDGDTHVRRALDSTAGFTFLLSSLQAALEHDITLRVVLDAHPPDLPPPAAG